MFTLPNALSFMRIPLALLFLQENPFIRLSSLCLALLTDGLDGFLARRQNKISSLGTFLDPLTDKFFVFFTLGILLTEHTLAPWKVVAMLCRDCAIIIFGIYLFLTGQLGNARPKAIWCGKITTVLQFAVLMSLCLNVEIPSKFFISFVILGILALAELYIVRKRWQKKNSVIV